MSAIEAAARALLAKLPTCDQPGCTMRATREALAVPTVYLFCDAHGMRDLYFMSPDQWHTSCQPVPWCAEAAALEVALVGDARDPCLMCGAKAYEIVEGDDGLPRTSCCGCH